MNRPFIELHCEDYTKINDDIINYLKTRTEILDRDPRKNSGLQIPYPNFVDTLDFVRHNPRLVEYFSSLKLRMFHVYYAVTFSRHKNNTQNAFEQHGYQNPDEISSCPIHVDRPPIQWKMNWPVLNMIGTGVRFFACKEPGTNPSQYVVRTGIANSLDQDVWRLPYEPFYESHKHVFSTHPILMNGLVPHDVWFPEEEMPLPRIGLQIMFFQEPRHLLSDDCVILN